MWFDNSNIRRYCCRPKGIRKLRWEPARPSVRWVSPVRVRADVILELSKRYCQAEINKDYAKVESLKVGGRR